MALNYNLYKKQVTKPTQNVTRPINSNDTGFNAIGYMNTQNRNDVGFNALSSLSNTNNTNSVGNSVTTTQTQSPTNSNATSVQSGLNGMNANLPKGPTYNAPTYNSEAEKTGRKAIIDAGVANTIAQLENAKQRALGNVQLEQDKLGQNYQDKKNTMAGQSAVSARNFAEYLARRGQSSSGALNRAMMSVDNNLTSGLYGLDRDQANAIAELEKRRTEANNDYEMQSTLAKNKGIVDYNSYSLDADKTAYQYAREDARDKFNIDTSNYKDSRDAFLNYYKTQGKIVNPLTGQLEDDPAYVLARKQAEQQAIINARKDFRDTTGYDDPTIGITIPENIMKQIEPYSGNYAQASKDLAQTNPELSRWLEIASVKKMMANPSLRQQFGQQYLTQEGMKNYLDNQQTQVQTAGFQLDNLIKNTELAYKEPQLQAQLQKDLELIKEAQIKNQYLPQEKMSEINERIASAQATLIHANNDTIRTHNDTLKTQYDINKPYYNPNSSKKSSSTSDFSDSQKNLYKAHKSSITKAFVTKDGVDKTGIYNYLKDITSKGEDSDVVNTIANEYGINAKDYEFIPNRTSQDKPSNAFWPR